MQSTLIPSTDQNLFFWFRSNTSDNLINSFPFYDYNKYESDFLVYLKLNPNNSNGNFQVETNNGIHNISDELNYLSNNTDELIIKVSQYDDNIIITYLFGENDYIWKVLNLTDYFLGINLKFLEIELNDYIGDIKIYNDSGYGLRCKLVEVNGHTNGFEINKNSNEKYVYINGKWKQQKIK